MKGARVLAPMARPLRAGPGVPATQERRRAGPGRARASGQVAVVGGRPE